jgi:hypothetical protein
MQRTIAHVGVNQLSEQDWVATALRYAEMLVSRQAGGAADVFRG